MVAPVDSDRGPWVYQHAYQPNKPSYRARTAASSRCLTGVLAFSLALMLPEIRAALATPATNGMIWTPGG